MTPLTLMITKVSGGYTIDILERDRRAVATTIRQAGKRAQELVEAALTEDEKAPS